MSSKYKRKGKGPRFVQLHEWMMRSEAWRSLDPLGRALYVELKRRYDGFNNGRIGLGCREAAEDLGVSKDTANRAFGRLQAFGFIRIAKQSGFNVKSRVSTEWTLTEFPDGNTGELAAKDFMKWRAPQSQIEDCSKNLQSQNPGPQSQIGDRNTIEGPHKPAHSIKSGTVSPISGDSQSHSRDTYRSTIGGRGNGQA
jgi:hypothetical protein